MIEAPRLHPINDGMNFGAVAEPLTASVRVAEKGVDAPLVLDRAGKRANKLQGKRRRIAKVSNATLDVGRNPDLERPFHMKGLGDVESVRAPIGHATDFPTVRSSEVRYAFASSESAPHSFSRRAYASTAGRLHGGISGLAPLFFSESCTV